MLILWTTGDCRPPAQYIVPLGPVWSGFFAILGKTMTVIGLPYKEISKPRLKTTKKLQKTGHNWL